MTPNWKKYASAVAATFIGGFCGALTIPPGANTWAQVSPVIGGALVAGVIAVTHLLQAPPTSGQLGDHEAAVIANIEALLMRRVVSDPNVTALLERAEKANSAALDTGAMMVAHAVAGHLAAITANPPPAVLAAMLDAVPALAASTPVEAPATQGGIAAQNPMPANDVTKGAS